MENESEVEELASILRMIGFPDEEAISEIVIKQGYRKSPQKEQLVEKELFDIVETELQSAMTKGWISGEIGFNTKLPLAIAKAICSRFSRPEVKLPVKLDILKRSPEGREKSEKKKQD